MNKKNITTAIIMAILVGSLLNLINSYDVFLEGAFTVKNTLKIMLTYTTPFFVSLFSSVNAAKQKGINGN
jgi:hypothetical protein